MLFFSTIQESITHNKWHNEENKIRVDTISTGTIELGPAITLVTLIENYLGQDFDYENFSCVNSFSFDSFSVNSYIVLIDLVLIYKLWWEISWAICCAGILFAI